MELKKEMLKEIMDNFANEDRIFSNESQFQFALALALQNYQNGKLIEREGDGIQLEVLSTYPFHDDINDKSGIEKMYTDIVVTSGGKHYAIELKYKTAYPSKKEYVEYKNKENKDGNPRYYTFRQGAADCGSYDFLKDVERLERLVLDGNNHISFNFSNKQITKGFAIILSNESLYWNSENRHLDNSPYKDFFMFDNKSIGGELGEDSKSRGEERNAVITLSKSYKINWQPYIPKNYEYVKESEKQRKEYNFKYMILEIGN